VSEAIVFVALVIPGAVAIGFMVTGRARLGVGLLFAQALGVVVAMGTFVVSFVVLAFSPSGSTSATGIPPEFVFALAMGGVSYLVASYVVVARSQPRVDDEDLPDEELSDGDQSEGGADPNETP